MGGGGGAHLTVERVSRYEYKNTCDFHNSHLHFPSSFIVLLYYTSDPGNMLKVLIVALVVLITAVSVEGKFPYTWLVTMVYNDVYSSFKG